MSLRRRLLVTMAPLIVAGFVAVNVVVYLALHGFLLQRVDDQLFSTHIAVEQALGGRDFGPGPGPGGPGSVQSLPPNTYGALLSSSGAVLTQRTFVTGAATSDGESSTTHAVIPADLLSATTPAYVSLDGAGSVNHYRAYLDSTHDGSGDLVLAAIPVDDVDSTLNRLLLVELGVAAGVTVVVLAATWLIVRRGLRPLERMGTTARSIVASDLSRRVTPSTESTEVGRLGLALNTMLGQLEAAFAERDRQEQRLRHFISDASHELRTPLTSMQGYAELLLRNPEMDRDDALLAQRRIQSETTRMAILVDDLLLLARLDQGRPLDRGAVDLGSLVTDACADARAADPGRLVSATVEAPLVVTGDDMRLRQVLGNLMRNALVHTPAETPVEVALRRQGGFAVIEVIDHGPGIPAGHSARIFERFHRADPGRSGDQGGSGLGLSIAAAVVAAHGGRIRVVDTPGGGATFRIELPLAERGEPVVAAATDPAAEGAAEPA